MSKQTSGKGSAAGTPADAGPAPTLPESTTRAQRWRLVLGAEGDNNLGPLPNELQRLDLALATLYDESPDQMRGSGLRGGRGGSAPSVARWLGDIRKYFPTTVVQLLQRDAMERLRLKELMLQPEMLEAVQPDVHMVADLISLAGVIPSETKATARLVVAKVVDDLMRRLDEPMRSAVAGALNRSQRNRRPRHSEIDWGRTIQANLRHYQRELKTVVPQRLVGYGRKIKRPQRELILCVDQSGSMMHSVIYSSIFAAVLASLPTVATRLIVFDTAVVDLTEELDDPVDLLFGVQLGGGTDINRAVGYCQSLVREPRNTIMVLISDLIEGGVEAGLLRRAAELVDSGVQVIVLLALSDEGKPAYDHALAAKLAGIGIPSFACTPDAFPALMAAAIKREDIALWAAENGIVATEPKR